MIRLLPHVGQVSPSQSGLRVATVPATLEDAGSHVGPLTYRASIDRFRLPNAGRKGRASQQSLHTGERPYIPSRAIRILARPRHPGSMTPEHPFGYIDLQSI